MLKLATTSNVCSENLPVHGNATGRGGVSSPVASLVKNEVVNSLPFRRAEICNLTWPADFSTSWLAVGTGDVPYVVKPATGDLTSRVTCDTISQSWVELRWASLVSSGCKTLVWTGLWSSLNPWTLFSWKKKLPTGSVFNSICAPTFMLMAEELHCEIHIFYQRIDLLTIWSYYGNNSADFWPPT